MGANQPTRNPAKCLASCPRNFPVMAGQWPQQCRRMAVETTRKTTCPAPDLDAPETCETTGNLAAQQLASSFWECRRQLLTMTSKKL